MKAYILCVRQLFEDITTMTRLIAKLPAHVPAIQVEAMQEAIKTYHSEYEPLIARIPTDEQKMRIAEYRYKLESMSLREKIIREITILINTQMERKQDFSEPVFIAAQEWIIAEQEKLNKLLN